MLELILVEGGSRAKTICLNFDKAWFGRQPTCDYVLEGRGASRVHFSIVRRGDDYVLIDNKSSNGTFVNRAKVTEAILRAGDEISAGQVVMQVRESTGEPNLPFRFVTDDGEGSGRDHIFNLSRILLGRRNFCQVHLNEPAVSAVHAEIESRAEGVWITDQSSGAGIYVNGRRVVTQQIHDGDVVVIRPFEIAITLGGGVCGLKVSRPATMDSSATSVLPEAYRDVLPGARITGEAKPSAPIAARPAWMQATAPVWVPTSDILPNRFRNATAAICLLGGLVWAGTAWMTRSPSLYSPGPTSTVHSSASPKFQKALAQKAASECAVCHSGFSRSPDKGCASCHQEEHATPAHQKANHGTGTACASCHAEHRGADVDLARSVGVSCRVCHVQVHQKPDLLLASRKHSTPAPVAKSVAFEANMHFGRDADNHPQHKTAKVRCVACHDDEEAEQAVPRAIMRTRCLSCHGFGTEATLEQRCYSCHFEHATKTPEKLLTAVTFPASQAPSAARRGNSQLTAPLLPILLFAVPLFYFVIMAGRSGFEHNRLRALIGAGVRSAPMPVPPGALLPDAGVATVAEPGPTPAENQSPGGTQRPLINLDLCVGCGSCVQVCPFSVLEIINEKAIAARLGDCTGVAACAAECPTGAITLVTGGAMQTVELPVYNHNLETNVPGLYLAGEVTGKALIKVAINQGRQVVESILNHPPEPGPHFDVIVVGSGPAGTSAALAAMKEGFKVLVLEQGTQANTIRTYPRQKFVMAEPVNIPTHGPLWMADTSKEALLKRWQEIITAAGLVVQEEEKVLRVVREPGRFLVQSSRGEYRGSRLVLAIGRRGSPRKLGVPGEDSVKVAYNLLDADAYHDKAICIVGGGDSGIEAAIGLSRQDLGNRVSLVHNAGDFTRAKPRNQKKIQKTIAAGRLKIFFTAAVTEVRPDSIIVRTTQGLEEIANDCVFVMVGGESPKQFLGECGIEFSTRAL